MTVADWLLDSDPSIRWQVMRDLTDAPAGEVAAERARVAREGVGARLLALQAADGRWGGAAWNRGWTSTMHVLWLLRHLGLDPAGVEARRAVGLVRDQVTWKGCGPQECDGNSFFAGEVEPCINGQVAAAGAYFGQDVRSIVHRLLGEQLRTRTLGRDSCTLGPDLVRGPIDQVAHHLPADRRVRIKQPVHD